MGRQKEDNRKDQQDHDNIFENAVREALEEYNPSAIARYCFDLSQKFNDFYSKRKILKADSEDLVKARLGACFAVKQVLENALKLLMIDTVEEM